MLIFGRVSTTKWKMLYGCASQRWGSVTREVSKAVLRIRDMLGRIRIRICGSAPLTNWSGSAILVSDLQDGKKSQNRRNQGFFLLFLLDDPDRDTDPEPDLDPGGPKTCRFGYAILVKTLNCYNNFWQVLICTFLVTVEYCADTTQQLQDKLKQKVWL